ncbi:hypothetical protein AMTRI_Chr04g180990 [Amborella trichopoda]
MNHRSVFLLFPLIHFLGLFSPFLSLIVSFILSFLCTFLNQSGCGDDTNCGLNYLYIVYLQYSLFFLENDYKILCISFMCPFTNFWGLICSSPRCSGLGAILTFVAILNCGLFLLLLFRETPHTLPPHFHIHTISSLKLIVCPLLMLPKDILLPRECTVHLLPRVKPYLGLVLGPQILGI